MSDQAGSSFCRVIGGPKNGSLVEVLSGVDSFDMIDVCAQPSVIAIEGQEPHRCEYPMHRYIRSSADTFIYYKESKGDE